MYFETIYDHLVSLASYEQKFIQCNLQWCLNIFIAYMTQCDVLLLFMIQQNR